MFIFQKKTIKDQTKNKILENFFAKRKKMGISQ